MRPKNLVLAAALVGVAVLAGTSCAQGAAENDDPSNDVGGEGGAGDDGGSSGDGSSSCGDTCDSDGDKVPDKDDKCPGTPQGAPVNKAGCAESQLSSKLEAFPPFGLTWTPTGNLGRAGGATWSYTGIQRADLFHIWWIVCDDPATPCGLSLDGPIDVAAEKFQFSAAESNLAGGKLVFTNTTHVSIVDAGTPTMSGRLTVAIVDPTNGPIPFADVATLGVTNARDGKYGAEIGGTGFKVQALVEVLDGATWKPFLDYYDGASTPNTGDAGGNAVISFGASFYDK
jgi:hypothetical protein